MLQINNVDVFISDIPILRKISLKIEQESIVSIVGSNGAGKTTLLKTMSGLLRPASGEIVFMEKIINDLLPHKRVEMGLIRVPEGREIFTQMSVLENLEMGSFTKKAKAKRKENLRRIYSLFPVLMERKEQIAGTLSGGEQQMLAIARGLMSMPILMMLDEPSVGLSPLLVGQIFEIIRDINKLGTTILLVEQDVYHSLSMAKVGYVLENGSIVSEGKGEDLLQSEDIKKAYLGL
jgi:branched-chain amino acid transport system ATP-binding protein